MLAVLQAVELGGAPLQNAMVVTVGKSWASMHDGRLPHGDPDATTLASPALGVGPIYFNEQVQPDPTQLLTSLDGGVAWLNLPMNNTYYVTAAKQGVTYPTVNFRIEEADVANGVQLHIASPPDSLEGSNGSGPGQPQAVALDRGSGRCDAAALIWQEGLRGLCWFDRRPTRE